MVQNLYKNWLLVSKIIWGIWITSNWQAVESSKSWNSVGYTCRKNTFLQLKHYIQRMYLTLLSTTVKTHQISYVIFETKSHFSRHNLSLFFLAQKLHNFDISIPSKCKFSDFPKFTKLFMSFFKQKVSFSSKVRSLFSVMRDNSAALF